MIKLAPTSLKIHQIIRLFNEGALIPRPEFQRRLVWSHGDKVNFIDTILKEYPFPEIYIADGEVDLKTGNGTQLLVDGQQRITTIIDYFNGDLKRRAVDGILRYENLPDDRKAAFLQYDIAVRNLGSLSDVEIKEVFRRINATSYSLSDIEINNAVYAGKFKALAEKIADDDFFEKHKFFRPNQIRRMGDTKYAATMLATMIGGYFNRDDLLEEYLSRYNEEFANEAELSERVDKAIENIEKMDLGEGSRAWKQVDFFTLFVEVDVHLFKKKMGFDFVRTSENLRQFYADVDLLGSQSRPASEYYLASVQAVNDRINRVRRGNIVRSMFVNEKGEQDAFLLV